MVLFFGEIERQNSAQAPPRSLLVAPHGTTRASALKGQASLSVKDLSSFGLRTLRHPFPGATTAADEAPGSNLQAENSRQVGPVGALRRRTLGRVLYSRAPLSQAFPPPSLGTIHLPPTPSTLLLTWSAVGHAQFALGSLLVYIVTYCNNTTCDSHALGCIARDACASRRVRRAIAPSRRRRTPAELRRI